MVVSPATVPATVALPGRTACDVLAQALTRLLGRQRHGPAQLGSARRASAAAPPAYSTVRTARRCAAAARRSSARWQQHRRAARREGAEQAGPGQQRAAAAGPPSLAGQLGLRRPELLAHQAADVLGQRADQVAGHASGSTRAHASPPPIRQTQAAAVSACRSVRRARGLPQVSRPAPPPGRGPARAPACGRPRSPRRSRPPSPRRGSGSRRSSGSKTCIWPGSKRSCVSSPSRIRDRAVEVHHQLGAHALAVQVAVELVQLGA